MSEEKETWNMADATLKRLDFQLQQCTLYSQSGRLKEWKEVLMDMRRNVFVFMTTQQHEEITDRLKSLPEGWINPNGKLNLTHYPAVNELLDDVQIKILVVMKEKGLLMPKTKKSGKSILEM